MLLVAGIAFVAVLTFLIAIVVAKTGKRSEDAPYSVTFVAETNLPTAKGALSLSLRLVSFSLSCCVVSCAYDWS